jgi:hypothetical protein
VTSAARRGVLRRSWATQGPPNARWHGPTGLDPSEILAERLRSSISTPCQPVATPTSRRPWSLYEALVWTTGTIVLVGVTCRLAVMVYSTTSRWILGQRNTRARGCGGRSLRRSLSLPTPTDGGGGTNGAGSGTNGYQWQGVPHHVLHEPRQTISPFGYPQPGQPSYGVVAHIPAQQVDTDFEGQRPPRSPHVYVCCSRPPRPFKRSPKLVGNIHSIRVTLGLANHDVPVGRGYIRLWVSIPCDGPEIS